jgi:transposase
MGAEEQLRLDVIVKVMAGQVTREQAEKILDVSERTVRRYLEDYREEGAFSVKHGNYERVPVNRFPEEKKEIILGLVKDKYYDFNMLHCLEKLEKDEQLSIGRETFRKWCHEMKMVKRAKRRKAKARYQRRRMQQTGLMVQMDGSPHRWFGGQPSCLIASIDDADSDIPYAEFFHSEDTISCMRVLQKIIERKGLFHILYVDKAGLFGGTKRTDFSQVKRALRELGIHIIFANSPEAKGRVERLFETLQDRLIPEMRIRKIKSYGVANNFLQEQFLPNEYRGKFTVTPGNLQTAYRSLPPDVSLKEIFCIKEYRTVARDHTLSWNAEQYALVSPVKYSIYKQKIELRTYQDLTWKAFFAGKEIALTKIERQTG